MIRRLLPGIVEPVVSFSGLFFAKNFGFLKYSTTLSENPVIFYLLN